MDEKEQRELLMKYPEEETTDDGLDISKIIENRSITRINSEGKITFANESDRMVKS